MRPAISIVVFTVISGLGYGLAAADVVLPLVGVGAPAPPERLAAGIAAIVAVSVGLASSTLHLSNPRNGWRALMRVRTSWLSREAVLALIWYPIAIGYLVAAREAPGGVAAGVLAALTALVALGVIHCTAMIYACLRTIRQWNTPLTPVTYLLNAVMLGALALASVHVAAGGAAGAHAGAALALVGVALVAKVVYLAEMGLPRGSTINTATGFRLATVRLLDVGHSGPSFLTREFGYTLSRARLLLLRLLMLGLGYALPAALLLVSMGHPEASAAVHAALASALLGLLLERWLFFAEARHVVALYHGLQRA